MKVSVLIPTYNSERYLSECLDSVLEQDFSDMEILISDNRSTDDTVKIIENYAVRDTRIRWWQNPENLGLIINHNVCLREAQGEYIKFVHSDDKLLSPSTIIKLVVVLDDNSAVSLVGSASDQIDSHSRADDERDFFGEGVWDGKCVIRVCFEFEAAANYPGEPSLVMFRRSQALRGFPKDYDQSLDTAMWFHLLEQGDFACLPESLSAHRQHPAQQGAVNARRGNGKNEIELLMLLETYWAKSWVGGMATQRMLASQIRFLKKNRSKFGRWTEQADALLAQMQTRTNPVSGALFWLEHKTLRSFKKIRNFAIRHAFQRCKKGN